ncbi:hypothetical protein TRFO_42733 [Tritrichomonas foetus]|uniref:Uncharacterized protein n=1 Tax=Tritrichomonas foetus TaxID=1144522 RepID=A0A1J4KUU2_9EUKA|nr:hypothetical protein TRFO_42733 [Tritrichomonas foetus]|eukprot:OHT15055.1 hypothetical protein TRFO_42733 [Tritrichomonas foetus]
MKNLVLSRSNRMKRRKSAKINTEELEHVKFQKEVEAGLYRPTPDEVDQIVLIPHFEDKKLYNFCQPSTAPTKSSELCKNTNVPPGLSPEQYAKIREEAYKKAVGIYENEFSKDCSVIFKRKSLVNNVSVEDLLSLDKAEIMVNDLCYDSSYEVLRNAVIRLSQEVQDLDMQNKILSSHIQLLDKAKQMLEVTEKCSIEAVQWEKNKIKEYYHMKYNEKKEGQKRVYQRFIKNKNEIPKPTTK